MSIKWFILRTVLHIAFWWKHFSTRTTFSRILIYLPVKVIDLPVITSNNFAVAFAGFSSPVTFHKLRGQQFADYINTSFTHVNISKRDVWRISAAIKFEVSELCPNPVVRKPHLLFYTKHGFSRVQTYIFKFLSVSLSNCFSYAQHKHLGKFTIRKRLEMTDTKSLGRVAVSCDLFCDVNTLVILPGWITFT